MLGNVLALILVAIAAVIGFFSLEASAISFTAIAYASWLLLTALHIATKPPKALPLCRMLSAAEIEAYRNYHIFLQFPAAAEAYSAALNLFRVAGLVWGVICIWNGLYWLAAADIGFFFISGNIILKMNPQLYMVRAALNGNEVAAREMSLLESVQIKRNIYNAKDDT